MNKFMQLVLRFEQFIRFSFIGIINSCIAFITNAIALHFLEKIISNIDIRAQIAAVIAFIFSSANGYLWNKVWIFNKARTKNSFGKFYISYGSTFILGQTVTFILVHNGFNPYIAPIPTMAVTFMANFFLSKYWAFKNHDT
jgi:putative flippase GtrA